MGVAAKVSSGEADVGVGIEKAARLVGQVDFIPLVQERYDLVMLRKQGNEAWIESVFHILRSSEFRQELRAFEGMTYRERVKFYSRHSCERVEQLGVCMKLYEVN